MDRKQVVNGFVCVALGVALAWVVNEVFIDKHADRRFALYNVIRELHKGMPRNEVEAIIERHNTPFITKHVDRDRDYINLTVQLGGRNRLYLVMEFSEGKLAKAHFGGEDNPWDVPNDAPSKIE